MRRYTPKNMRPVPPEAERVFKGIIYDVYHWQQQMFDGSLATFEMLKRPDTVQIIAIKDGAIVTIIDEQPSYEPRLRLPGGRHDVAAETELDAAKREMREETGMRFKTWKLIAAGQVHNKIDQVIYTFLATDFEGEDKPHLDAGEKIEIHSMSFGEAKQHAENGDITYWPNDIFRPLYSLGDLTSLPDLLSAS